MWNLLFLNEHLEEEIFVEQSIGYVVKGHENKVLKLKRVLYEVKQSLRTRNSIIDKYFWDNNFIKCSYEHALYMKVNKKSDILLVCLYVDDLIFVENNSIIFDEFKEVMASVYKMIDIGLIS